MAKIDLKYLQGIKMTGATEKIVEKDGRKTSVSIPWERAAKEEDVVSLKDYGDYVVVVIKDGMKYKIEKNPKKDTAAKE